MTLAVGQAHKGDRLFVPPCRAFGLKQGTPLCAPQMIGQHRISLHRMKADLHVREWNSGDQPFVRAAFREIIVLCIRGHRQIDPAAIASLVKSKIIIDGRNMLDRTLWRKAGWKFHALGRTD